MKNEKIAIFTNSKGSSYQVRWFQVKALYTDSIDRQVKTKTFKTLKEAENYTKQLS